MSFPQLRFIRFNFNKALAATSLIKTFLGLANASTKTVNGLARASVKTKNGLA